MTPSQRAKAIQRAAVVILLAAAAVGIVLVLVELLTPLDLNRPPNFFTKIKLQLLKGDPERCFAALDRNQVSYRRAPPLQRVNGCGYEDAAYLESSGVRHGSRILLRCPALLSVLLWERHVLISAANKHFGRNLVSVRHLGTYACRNINRQRGMRLSQHAYANAIDVAGFEIEGGPSISVSRDWKDESERGRFLREVRDGACRTFSVVLSPEHDRAHGNHFHFDMGLGDTCG